MSSIVQARFGTEISIHEADAARVGSMYPRSESHDLRCNINNRRRHLDNKNIFEKDQVAQITSTVQ